MQTMPAGGPSVLIVDDDKFFHVVLRQMLGLLGVEDVHSASDGREALRLLKSLPRPTDFLICDVYMPELDGLEFVDALAATQYPGRIMMVSGLDPTMLDLSRLIASQGGLNIIGAFTKPVALQQLSEAMGLAVVAEEDEGF